MDALAFDFEDRLDDVMPDPALGVAVDHKTGWDASIGKRVRTVVCRHWLRGLCQKGDNCEYLHRMDLDKMPICRWGKQCQVKDCQFKHIDEEDKPECIFYKHGFCRHGPSCRFRHIKLAHDDCPTVADFSLKQAPLPGGPAADVQAAEVAARFEVGQHSPAFRTALCKHYMENGECPFNDKCLFAHGEEQLRAYQSSGVPAGQRPHVPAGPAPPRALDNPLIERALPVRASESVRYFVIKSVNYKNLAISVKQTKWRTRQAHATMLNQAYTSCDRVIFVFSVNNSRNFQGCAQMASRIPILPEAQRDPQWTPEFVVEWLRLCELPFSSVMHLTNPLNDNMPILRSRDGQELPSPIGRELLGLMWMQPEVSLPDEMVTGDLELHELNALPAGRGGDSGSMDVDEDGPAGESGAGGPQGQWPPSVPNLLMPVPPGMPGYMFCCNNKTLDECLAKCLFGLPRSHLGSARGNVCPGTILFLLDITQPHRRVFGIFQALTPVTDNLDPTAFHGGPNRGMAMGGSPFPAQVKVGVVLEAPPITSNDNDMRRILRGPARYGPLNIQQTQELAQLLAKKAGTTFPPLTGPGNPQAGPMMGYVMGMPMRPMVSAW